MPRRKFSEIKIGVIGTINRDTIYQADGSVVKSWGGILYNIKYLCEAGKAIILPVVNIGRDCSVSLNRFLKQYGNLDCSNISIVDELNNHCVLRYSDQSSKREILKGGVPALSCGRVKPLLECDAVLVNFISGRDIKLVALERFRSEYNGLIYMDIHSLMLGRKKISGGVARYLRRPRYRRRYAACADILQVNQVEFELLAGCDFERKTAVSFFKRELPTAKALIITLGADGCLAVYRRGTRIIGRMVSSPQVRRVFDTTGCGDIFAAGFLIEYLMSDSFIRAASEGNRLAAQRCGEKGKIF
ncbi:MAG: carbohydrate kinase family protein [FCB group bacterium]|nr:carbohydrate kinase family protein [FCB group bacterium]